jgi:hypothetical protein
MFATGNHTCRSYGFWPAWSDSALRMYMNWLSRTVGAGWLAAASATLASQHGSGFRGRGRRSGPS